MNELRTNEDATILAAICILHQRLKIAPRDGTHCYDHSAVRDLAKCTLADKPYEMFKGMFFDTRGRLISCDTLALGTVSVCPTYTREVLRAALDANASHIILAHNHPNGAPFPSEEDIKITREYEALFKIIDVRLLDHLIVAGTHVYSMADNGQI